MTNYELARPNETKLVQYLEETCADWEKVAKDILAWLSDDDVRDWARCDGYDEVFEDEEEEEDEDD